MINDLCVEFDFVDNLAAMKILIVEDEIKVAEVLKRGLEEASYTVDVVHDGQEALQQVASNTYELILLDINLPTMNGLEVCKRIRERDNVISILMLTALSMSEDIVNGLEAGADDYMAKPFRFNELYARVKALTRRKKIINELTQSLASSSEKRDVFTLDDLEIDFDARTVTRAGKHIQLTAREYALLEYLARHAGKVRSRLEIAEAVWDLDFETGTNFIDVYINYLRNKIDKPFGRRLVQTVTGFGYVLKLPQA